MNDQSGKCDSGKKWFFYASLILFAGLVLHVVLCINLSKVQVSAAVSGNVNANVKSGEAFGIPVALKQ